MEDDMAAQLKALTELVQQLQADNKQLREQMAQRPAPPAENGTPSQPSSELDRGIRIRDNPANMENTQHTLPNPEEREAEEEEEAQAGPSSLITPPTAQGKKKKKTNLPTREEREAEEEEGAQAGPSSVITSPPPQGKKKKKTVSSLPRKWLKVVCGDKRGDLQKSNFSSVQKCIKCQNTWYTPLEFETLGGKGKSKKWKTSITTEYGTLNKLIKNGKLKLIGSKKQAQRKTPKSGKRPSRKRKTPKRPIQRIGNKHVHVSVTVYKP